jgi:hypothetical protein
VLERACQAGQSPRSPPWPTSGQGGQRHRVSDTGRRSLDAHSASSVDSLRVTVRRPQEVDAEQRDRDAQRPDDLDLLVIGFGFGFDINGFFGCRLRDGRRRRGGSCRRGVEIVQVQAEIVYVRQVDVGMAGATSVRSRSAARSSRRYPAFIGIGAPPAGRSAVGSVASTWSKSASRFRPRHPVRQFGQDRQLLSAAAIALRWLVPVRTPALEALIPFVVAPKIARTPSLRRLLRASAARLPFEIKASGSRHSVSTELSCSSQTVQIEIGRRVGTAGGLDQRQHRAAAASRRCVSSVIPLRRWRRVGPAGAAVGSFDHRRA